MSETAMVIFYCLTGAVLLMIATVLTLQGFHVKRKIKRLIRGEESDLNELAWGLIANAYGGDWDTASPEWRQAAVRWRDAYHKTLPSGSDEAEVPA